MTLVLKYGCYKTNQNAIHFILTRNGHFLMLVIGVH